MASKSKRAASPLIGRGLVLVAASLIVIALAPLPKMRMRNLDFSPWGPLVVGTLTVLSYGWALQYFHFRYGKRGPLFFGLYLFFVWVAPIMVGGLLMVSGVQEAGYLMATSPPVGLFFASVLDIPRIDPIMVQVIAIAPTAILTFVFGILLLNREKMLIKEVFTEHDDRRREAEGERA